MLQPLGWRCAVNVWYTTVVIYTTRPQGFIQQKRTAVNRSHGQARMTMTNTKVKDANQGMHGKQSTRATFTFQGIDYHILPPECARSTTPYISNANKQ